MTDKILIPVLRTVPQCILDSIQVSASRFFDREMTATYNLTHGGFIELNPVTHYLMNINKIHEYLDSPPIDFKGDFWDGVFISNIEYIDFLSRKSSNGRFTFRTTKVTVTTEEPLSERVYALQYTEDSEGRIQIYIRECFKNRWGDINRYNPLDYDLIKKASVRVKQSSKRTLEIGRYLMSFDTSQLPIVVSNNVHYIDSVDHSPIAERIFFHRGGGIINVTVTDPDMNVVFKSEQDKPIVYTEALANQIWNAMINDLLRHTRKQKALFGLN